MDSLMAQTSTQPPPLDGNGNNTADKPNADTNMNKHEEPCNLQERVQDLQTKLQGILQRLRSVRTAMGTVQKNAVSPISGTGRSIRDGFYETKGTEGSGEDDSISVLGDSDEDDLSSVVSDGEQETNGSALWLSLSDSDDDDDHDGGEDRTRQHVIQSTLNTIYRFLKPNMAQGDSPATLGRIAEEIKTLRNKRTPATKRKQDESGSGSSVQGKDRGRRVKAKIRHSATYESKDAPMGVLDGTGQGEFIGGIGNDNSTGDAVMS